MNSVLPECIGQNMSEETQDFECDCGTCVDCDIKCTTGSTPKEIEYLNWFAINADFGPGHGDVMIHMQERYKQETGKEVPTTWKYE
jgi:Ni,Fe-hydrogenase III small subunit